MNLTADAPPGSRRGPRQPSDERRASADRGGHNTTVGARALAIGALGVEFGDIGAALEQNSHPAFSAATACLGRSYCHLIVDESFDMNVIDALVVERAIDPGVTVTLVGDPWQSL